MSVYSDVHKAFFTDLVALNIGLPIKTENVKINENEYKEFVKCSFLYNTQDPATKTGFSELTGIFQISIYIEKYSTMARPINIIDTLENHYKNNLRLFSGSHEVYIDTFEVGNIRYEENKCVHDISVYFNTYV